MCYRYIIFLNAAQRMYVNNINACILFEIGARFTRWVSKAIGMVMRMLTFTLQLEKRSSRIAMLLDTKMFMNLCEAYEILPGNVSF